MRGAAALALATVLGAAAAGCGGSSDVDMGQIEREIAQQSAQQARVDRRDVKVQCPQRESAAAGTTFSCDVVIDHVRRTLAITLQDGGTYTATPSATATVDAKQSPT